MAAYPSVTPLFHIKHSIKLGIRKQMFINIIPIDKNLVCTIFQWFVIKLFKLSGNFAIVPQFRDDLFIFISVGIDWEPFNKW